MGGDGARRGDAGVVGWLCRAGGARFDGRRDGGARSRQAELVGVAAPVAVALSAAADVVPWHCETEEGACSPALRLGNRARRMGDHSSHCSISPTQHLGSVFTAPNSPRLSRSSPKPKPGGLRATQQFRRRPYLAKTSSTSRSGMPEAELREQLATCMAGIRAVLSVAGKGWSEFAGCPRLKAGLRRSTQRQRLTHLAAARRPTAWP